MELVSEAMVTSCFHITSGPSRQGVWTPRIVCAKHEPLTSWLMGAAEGSCLLQG